MHSPQYLISLALVLTLPQGHMFQEDLGCFVQGECIGSKAVGFSLSDSGADCLDFCGTVNSCNYFTYYGYDDNCLAYEDCPDFNTYCLDCSSGTKMLQIKS